MRINGTPKERLLARREIDSITGCWLWKGAISDNGYGKMHYRGTTMSVHVASFKEFKGEPINQVNHIRECPNKHCFNPDHLYDGTQSENIQDSLANGSYHFNALKTHCPRGHEYNEQNTRMNNGERICKLCRHEDYLVKKEIGI